MSALQKLEILKDSYDDVEFAQIVDKLLDEALNQHRLRLERYAHDLELFEQRYEMTSDHFYQQFEAGELDDKMDFFEWAGLYKLKQDIEEKMKRLERTV